MKANRCTKKSVHMWFIDTTSNCDVTSRTALNGHDPGRHLPETYTGNKFIFVVSLVYVCSVQKRQVLFRS